MPENKPAIRFKGFENDWEQRKLGEVSEKIGSGKTPRGGSAVYTKFGIPLLRSQNIYDNKVHSSDLVFITNDIDKEMSNSRVKTNDVLLNITGASIGRSAVYRSIHHSNVNQHVCIIRPKKEFSADFIQLNIASSNGQRQIDLNQAGGGREGLNFQQIGKIYFNFPDKEEQQKIGSFFKILDNTITLHQQQLENLKKTKKAYLQKMFPKNNEKVPEIRFEGFADDWEQRKFKEFSKKMGKKNSQGLDFPAYSVSNKVGLIAQTDQFDGSRLDDLEKTSYKFVEPNEFAYNPARINVGSIAFNNLDKTVIVSSLYVVVKMSDNLDNEFVLQYIKSPMFIKEVRRNTEGSVREYLFYENFTNIKVPYTKNIEEQSLIGKFFKELDDTITLHQRKLDYLKEMKKGLLQKMFV